MSSKTQCERALDLHADRLSTLCNVVGLGIVPEADEGPTSGRFVLAIYVDKKLPLAELDPGDVLPKIVEVPGRGRSMRSITTRVIAQGEVALEGSFGKEPLPE